MYSTIFIIKLMCYSVRACQPVQLRGGSCQSELISREDVEHQYQSVHAGPHNNLQLTNVSYLTCYQISTSACNMCKFRIHLSNYQWSSQNYKIDRRQISSSAKGPIDVKMSNSQLSSQFLIRFSHTHMSGHRNKIVTNLYHKSEA